MGRYGGTTAYLWVGVGDSPAEVSDRCGGCCRDYVGIASGLCRGLCRAPGQAKVACICLGPAPINSEKRPQADTSLSRPVWPQFCFYPLRIIPQGTQSQGLRMRSDFGGVKNSMFLGHVEIYKSVGASGKSHLVLLWAPPQVKSSKFMYANG